MEDNLYSPDWWWALYNQDEWKEDIVDSVQNTAEVKAATLNLPKLITRVHAMHQISEPPKLLVRNKEYDYSKDIISKSFLPVSSLLGLGVIFIVPHIDSKGRKTFYTVRYDDEFEYIRYALQDDDLTFLSYKRREKIYNTVNGEMNIEIVTMRYSHYIQANSYFYKKFYYTNDDKLVYVDGQDGTRPISRNGKMLPFMINLLINADSCGQPIWCNAWRLIQDANRTYWEIFQEMEVNRTFIGIPENLVEDAIEDPIDCDKLKILSTKNRAFVIVNGVSDQQTWEKFGGDYKPDGYYRLLNAQLADISLHCGLSRKFLSYDNNAASVRTAKEVIFTNNDAFISQQLINQTMEKYFTQLIQAYYYMDNKKWIDDSKIEIKFADNVFNSHEDEINTAHMAFKANAITKEAYLKKLFPADNIADIMNNEDQNIPTDVPLVKNEGEIIPKEPKGVQTPGEKLQDKRPTSEV